MLDSCYPGARPTIVPRVLETYRLVRFEDVFQIIGVRVRVVAPNLLETNARQQSEIDHLSASAERSLEACLWVDMHLPLVQCRPEGLIFGETLPGHKFNRIACII